MEGCWSRRGCDDEMQGRCPHNVPGEPCPADCHYAACHRPTHVVCEDFGVLLNPNRDYDAAVKQVCRFCEHFLVNGRISIRRPARATSSAAATASFFRFKPNPELDFVTIFSRLFAKNEKAVG